MSAQDNLSYKHRLRSIDVLRGVAIILMALDHVRDYFGAFPYDAQDLLHVPAALFLTRWITNICAPAFMFLSGLSAYLYGLKVPQKELSFFLIKRGFFLIFLEITVVNFSWTFGAYPFVVLQVIWALGISMIFLAGLLWLPRQLIIFFSLLLIFGHNYFDNIILDTDSPMGLFWHFMHVPFDWKLGSITLSLSYVVFPWPGVMALGYGLGPWLEESQKVRNRKFLIVGALSLLLFMVLRCFFSYGDSYHWERLARGNLYTLLSFLKLSKYPPSLDYILFNLGLITILWPLWEKWRGFGSEVVLCFGKVAMFFYLLHLPLIHLLAELYSRIFLHAGGGWWALENNIPLPPLYHFHLGSVYLIWMALIIFMYPLCSWYRQYKETHRYPWLHYL